MAPYERIRQLRKEMLHMTLEEFSKEKELDKKIADMRNWAHRPYRTCPF